MIHLVLHVESETGPLPCGVCGRSVLPSSGPQLSRGDTLEPVCRECGTKHAPTLATLVELARAAEHVGRIGRHTVTPPLTALLDLSRAAEDYAATLPQQRLQAG